MVGERGGEREEGRRITNSENIREGSFKKKKPVKLI
jgi:hypothetical protein